MQSRVAHIAQSQSIVFHSSCAYIAFSLHTWLHSLHTRSLLVFTHIAQLIVHFTGLYCTLQVLLHTSRAFIAHSQSTVFHNSPLNSTLYCTLHLTLLYGFYSSQSPVFYTSHPDFTLDFTVCFTLHTSLHTSCLRLYSSQSAVFNFYHESLPRLLHPHCTLDCTHCTLAV